MQWSVGSGQQTCPCNFLLTTDDSALSDKDCDDAGAGLPWSEVGANALLHGEAAAFVAAEADGGRGAVLQKSDKRDIHRRSVFADDRGELYKAHRTADAGNPAGKGATDENIPASRKQQNQVNREKG